MSEKKTAPTLTAVMIRRMFLSGAYNLENQKERINELNVFPVPDGDTGTNMSLTVTAACDAVSAVEKLTVDSVTKAISSGSLRGARGNSGVILSQLFRGFSKVAKEYDELDVDAITRAMDRAVATAYKAVMKPKEGTILTVARGMSERAAEVCPTVASLDDFFEEVLTAGRKALANTPELLPVLKEAGVVDSGGQGLLAVIEGAIDAYRGNPHTLNNEASAPEEEAAPVYRVEFRVICAGDAAAAEQNLRKQLAGKAEELILSADGKILTVHCAAEEPGTVLQCGLAAGYAEGIRIYREGEETPPAACPEKAAQTAAEDRNSGQGASVPAANKEPQPPVQAEPKEHSEAAFIAVCCGKGMASIFRDLGVDHVLEGGQTMNPSTDDILAAVSHVNADVVYVLPNNKNIILAANQAASLADGCRVVVVPTKTVPQGITAVVSYVPGMSPEENLRAMSEEILRVKSGEVTYSVRDTKIDGIEIRNGDLMGIGDGKILSVGSDLEAVVSGMLGKMVDDSSELVSIYAGADLTEEQAESLAESVREAYPQVEVELNDGGQPVYYCILSVE